MMNDVKRRVVDWLNLLVPCVLLNACITGGYREPECPLVITLKARSFATVDEIAAEFSPPWLQKIQVYPPGPRAFPAPKEVVSRNETLVSETIPGSELPFRVTLKEFEVTAHRLLSAMSWYRLAWFDAYDEGHVPPGWYQIQLTYAPTNGSRDTCILTTAPFYIEEEFTIPKGEFFDPNEYVWWPP